MPNLAPIETVTPEPKPVSVENPTIKPPETVKAPSLAERLAGTIVKIRDKIDRLIAKKPREAIEVIDKVTEPEAVEQLDQDGEIGEVVGEEVQEGGKELGALEMDQKVKQEESDKDELKITWEEVSNNPDEFINKALN